MHDLYIARTYLNKKNLQTNYFFSSYLVVSCKSFNAFHTTRNFAADFKALTQATPILTSQLYLQYLFVSDVITCFSFTEVSELISRPKIFFRERSIYNSDTFLWHSVHDWIKNVKNTVIDHYAKDGGLGEVWILCSFYHEPLRTLIKTNVNKFVISSHTALKLRKQAMKSYSKITCEFQLRRPPNKKVSAGKDYGWNYMKFRPPLARHL